jgi:hypothetical protein
MEALMLAIAVVQSLLKTQKPLPAETQTFQPLDFQSLRYVYGAQERSAKRSSDRSDSHLAQAVS